MMPLRAKGSETMDPVLDLETMSILSEPSNLPSQSAGAEGEEQLFFFPGWSGLALICIQREHEGSSNTFLLMFETAEECCRTV